MSTHPISLLLSCSTLLALLLCQLALVSATAHYGCESHTDGPSKADFSHLEHAKKTLASNERGIICYATPSAQSSQRIAEAYIVYHTTDHHSPTVHNVTRRHDEVFGGDKKWSYFQLESAKLVHAAHHSSGRPASPSVMADKTLVETLVKYLFTKSDLFKHLEGFVKGPATAPYQSPKENETKGGESVGGTVDTYLGSVVKGITWPLPSNHAEDGGLTAAMHAATEDWLEAKAFGEGTAGEKKVRFLDFFTFETLSAIRDDKIKGPAFAKLVRDEVAPNMREVVKNEGVGLVSFDKKIIGFATYDPNDTDTKPPFEGKWHYVTFVFTAKDRRRTVFSYGRTAVVALYHHLAHRAKTDGYMGAWFEAMPLGGAGLDALNATYRDFAWFMHPEEMTMMRYKLFPQHAGSSHQSAIDQARDKYAKEAGDNKYTLGWYRSITG